MAMKCQAPDCGHEFDDSVSWDELDARDAGETPYFTHVFEPADGFGVTTSYLCSADCMEDYLEDLSNGDDA